jgi:hypothetical protein
MTEYDSAVSSVATKVKGIATTCGNYTPSIVGCSVDDVRVCDSTDLVFPPEKNNVSVCVSAYLSVCLSVCLFPCDLSLLCISHLIG